MFLSKHVAPMRPQICSSPPNLTITHPGDADDKLFINILNNPDHTLHYLLPKRTTHDYDLRPRRHNLEARTVM